MGGTKQIQLNNEVADASRNLEFFSLVLQAVAEPPPLASTSKKRQKPSSCR